MSDDELLRFESKWKEIYSEGIEKVFRIADTRTESINLSQYTKLYTMAYDICVSKSTVIPIKLYDRITETIKVYCVKVFEKIRSSRNILQDFVDSWTTFEETVLKWILKLFSYLTRQNFKVKKNLNLEMDLKMSFKDQIYDKIKPELNYSFFLLMDAERRGELTDSTSLKKFIKFLSSIEVSYMEYLYNNNFESDIMLHTLNFYRPLINELFNNSDFTHYLHWGQSVIRKEEERLSIYLPMKTVKSIVCRLREDIFFNQNKVLLESPLGFKALLQKNSFDDLKSTYDIFSQEQKSLHILLLIFKNFIREEFKSLIEKTDSACNYNDGPREVAVKTNYVDEFINFYSLNTKIIFESFGGSNMFNVSYKEVLENVQSSNSKFNNSYILPFYIDKNLKRSPHNHSSEASAIIDKILSVFPSLPDKDIFIDIHKNLLSTRILNEDFISIDVEKYLINKLKLLCGVEFTSNLEGMINDYFNNKDLNEKYKIWLRESQIKSQVDTNYSILTAEIWPNLNVTNIKIPKEIQQSTDQFQNFYIKSHPKKLLKWSYLSSMAEIEGKMESRNYLFVVNCIQAVILLQFNEFRENEVNLNLICSRVGIDSDKELKTYLLPLITSKLLLKCEVNDSGDFIKLNKKFSFNSMRVKITSNPRNDEIIKKEKIEDDRSWAIEATIVRIMKSTQRLHHNDLVKRILDQMEHFKVQIHTIKKKIDNLLERELICRDHNDPSYYLYSSN